MSFMLQGYKRIGSFVIDMTIVQMFSTVVIRLILGIVAYMTQGSETQWTLNDDIALPMLLAFILMCFGVIIGVYMAYHWVGYRLLKTSLSRYFLRLVVESTNDEVVTQSRYLNREFKKIYFTIMTLGLYALYNGAQLLAHGHPPWHDKHYQTQVTHF